MRVGFLLVLALIVASLPVSGAFLYGSECREDGSFQFTVQGDEDAKAETEPIVLKVEGKEVYGAWDRAFFRKSSESKKAFATFTGEENQLLQKKSYLALMEYALNFENGTEDQREISFTLDCPGLVYTCKQLGLELTSCTNEEGAVRAELLLTGLQQSPQATMVPEKVLDFQFVMKERYKDIRGASSREGSLPEKYQILHLGTDQYVMRAPLEDGNWAESLLVMLNEDLYKPCPASLYPDMERSEYVKCTSEGGLPMDASANASVEGIEEGNASVDSAEEAPPKKKMSEAQVLTLVVLLVLALGGGVLYYLSKQGYF